MASTSATIYKSIDAEGVPFDLSFTASFSTYSGLTVAVACLQSSYGANFYDNYTNSWSASNGASGTYTLGTLYRGGSKTLFTSSTPFSSGSVSVTFKFYNSNYTFTISANLGSDAVAGTIGTSNTNISLGNSTYFTVSGGSGVTYKIFIDIGGSRIDTGLTGSGNYTFNADTYAKYIPSTSSSKVATAVLISYLSGSQYGTSSVSVILTETNNAYTFSSGSITPVSQVNGYYVISKSSIKYITTLEKRYTNETATITSLSAIGKYTGTTISDATFTTTQETSGTKVIITSTLNGNFPVPSDTSVSQYQMTYTLYVTDSRGVTYEVPYSNPINVLCYIAPEISNIDITRCDSSGNLSPSGVYAKVSVTIKASDYYSIESCLVTINNNTYILSTSDNTTYAGVVGKGALATNTQYACTIKVRTTDMKSYNSNLWITQSTILPTMQLPISLFDDTDQVGVSFGEMAQKYSDVSADSVVNFTKGLKLRATSDSDGSVISKDAYELLSLSGGGAKIYVQTTTNIPAGMEEGDILVVYNQ